MQAVAPYKEAADIIREQGGEILKLCYQCGMCTATCPWNLVRSFPVRKLIHLAQLGLIDFEDEDGNPDSTNISVEQTTTDLTTSIRLDFQEMDQTYIFYVYAQDNKLKETFISASPVKAILENAKP